MRKLIALLVGVCVLGGCAWLPVSPEMPVGVGRGTDQLKPTRCSCDVIYRNGRVV